MSVLIYQLVIVASLILTRFLAPNRLLVASWIWTGLTLLNLFWPPLIVLQLLVIWGTFGLLGKSSKAPNVRASDSCNTKDREPTSKVFFQSSPARDQPLPKQQPTSSAASPNTLLGGIQQGASKLATATGELSAYVNRKKQIQDETIEMLSAYRIERHRIELALNSAEQRLELKRKLDADPGLKELFEETYAKMRAAHDRTRDTSTVAPSELQCVDLRLPLLHREPEIASAVDRKYTETIDEYSRFLKTLMQRLQRQEGLRGVFEESMLRTGGAKILKRIKSFEAGMPWTYPWAPTTLVEILDIPNAEGDEQVVKAAANPRHTQPPPSEHALSVSAYIAPSASRDQSSTPVSQLLNADVTEPPPYTPHGGISLSDIEESARTAKSVSRPTSSTLIDILDTVGPAANTVTRTINTASISVEMLNAFALKAPREQAIRYKAGEAREPELIQLRVAADISRREEIKKTAIARRIPALYHFTRTSNLESIVKHGLCSISGAGGLDIKPHVNDRLRLDGYPDAVSLSIAFPNDRMFYKYRRTEPNEEWVILAINPAILWRKKCAFCERNAADHRIRERPLADLMNADAFRGMFEEMEGVAPREEQRLMDYDPTDPQAEVLVFDTIEPAQIVGVSFDSHKVLNAFSHLLGERHSSVFQRNTGPFGARSFARTATH